MQYDEELIALVRALTDVQSICTNKRVYHLQVLQANPNNVNFPCIVYNMSANTPFNELDSASGLRKADFQFDCYSELSGQIRTLQTAIDTLNQTLGTLLEWIEVTDTTDGFDFPIDLDERGVKAAQMTVSVYYRSNVESASVVSVSPVDGAEDVAANVNVSVTFSDDVDFSESFIVVKDADGKQIEGTTTYASGIASFNPTEDLPLGAVITAYVIGVVPYQSWSFTIAGSQSYSLWDDGTIPQNPDSVTLPVGTLGVKFRANVGGVVDGVRYWKAPSNTTPTYGRLYAIDGTLLGEVLFTGETASGWQQQAFNAPIAITADTLYIIAFYTSSGKLGFNSNYFATAKTTGPLTAPASGTVSGNGVYAESDVFPTNTFNATNYWVDVVFTPTP